MQQMQSRTDTVGIYDVVILVHCEECRDDLTLTFPDTRRGNRHARSVVTQLVGMEKSFSVYKSNGHEITNDFMSYIWDSTIQEVLTWIS